MRSVHAAATLARKTMKPEHEVRTFFFEDIPAGYFEDAQLPTVNGKYRYVPLRSVGHYRLMGALRSLGPQRCHFVVGGEKRYFLVLRLVEYGLLEIAELGGPGESQT